MLRLDYEALATSSKTLSQQGDIFEDCINTMSQVVSAHSAYKSSMFSFSNSLSILCFTISLLISYRTQR